MPMCSSRRGAARATSPRRHGTTRPTTGARGVGGVVMFVGVLLFVLPCVVSRTHTRTQHTYLGTWRRRDTPVPLQGRLSRAIDLITRAHVSLSFSLSFSHTTYHTSQTHTPTPDRSDQPSDLPQTPRIPDGKAKAGVPGQIDGKLSDDAKDITSGADLSSAASAVCEPNKRARYAKDECSVIVL